MLPGNGPRQPPKNSPFLTQEISPFVSLAQRNETKENIGCKLFAKNSVLRVSYLLIQVWELNSFRLEAELEQ
jgi:hypothetical protein